MEKRPQDLSKKDQSIAKKLKSSSVISSPAVLYSKTAIKVKDPNTTTVTSDQSLPSDFFDAPQESTSKYNQDLIIEHEYQKLKLEVGSMPLPEHYRGEDIEDIEELIDRDDEMITGDILLSRRMEILKNTWNNLSKVKKRRSDKSPIKISNKGSYKPCEAFNDELIIQDDDILK